MKSKYYLVSGRPFLTWIQGDLTKVLLKNTAPEIFFFVIFGFIHEGLGFHKHSLLN